MKRNTIQRKAILDTISEIGHASIKSIFECINNKGIKMPLVTVYRNVAFLEDVNLIRRVNVPSKEAFYEIVYPEQNHNHFICSKCGKIIDVNSETTFDEFVNNDGNLYQAKQVTFYGICKDCLAKESINK
ncbi:MAG: Fur family transcriptional regulator [Candidatus Onthovivens sp.]|nr:Fur family transcriptional regulator [Candidatus Onthovivens sp.]